MYLVYEVTLSKNFVLCSSLYVLQTANVELANTFCQKLHHHYAKKKISHILLSFSPSYTCLRNRKGLHSH